MTESLTAGVLIVACLLLSMGCLGLWLKPGPLAWRRYQTTLAAAVALALAAAGRRHGNPALDVIGWLLLTSSALSLGLPLWRKPLKQAPEATGDVVRS